MSKLILPGYFNPRDLEREVGTTAAPLPSELEQLRADVFGLKRQLEQAEKSVTHLAGTVLKVEGQMLEQARLFEETLAYLDNERELYARKFNDLQGLVKRLLEQKG